MDRTNHYESAFEAYMKNRGLRYAALDETRRSHVGCQSVKTPDFLVYGTAGFHFLVDIKGRRFPAGTPGRRRAVWECWSTLDDVAGLEYWEDQFGPGYKGLFVFCYEILPEITLPEDTEDLWAWQGKNYLLRAMAVREYRQHLRLRSPRWSTVFVPGPIFRKMVQPFRQVVSEPLVYPDESCFAL